MRGETDAGDCLVTFDPLLIWEALTHLLAAPLKHRYTNRHTVMTEIVMSRCNNTKLASDLSRAMEKRPELATEEYNDRVNE